MEKKNGLNKRFKRGSYSSALTLIVVVIVVAANLFIGELDAIYTEFDVSGKNLYDISEQTEEMLRGLQEDVTIYMVAQEKTENAILAEFVGRYGELSGHVKVKHVDPVENPAFTSKYSSDAVYENSLIVESEKRYKLVGYHKIFKQKYAGRDENGEEVYSTEFDGEGQLTAAIDYVVTDNLPTLYTLSGHEEMELPESLEKSIVQENIAVEGLNLITRDGVPENCDGIFIVGPKRDITDGEREMLAEYMDAGGKMFLIEDYGETEMPNLKSLMASYGLSVKDGIVLEGDADYYIRENYLTVPDYVNHAITEPMIKGNVPCLAITAQALLETSENQESKEAKISWLLKTSDKAFNKVELVDETSRMQTEEDETGSFYIGAASVKGSGENESAMVVLTTSAFISEDWNTYIAGGNYDLLINAIAWLCGDEDAIAIHTKNLDMEYIAISANQVVTWSIVLIIAFPLVLIAVGVVIWVVRRRR